MLKEVGKIAGVNLIIVLFYTAFSYAISPKNNHDYSFLIFMMMFIAAQAFINLVLSIIFFVKGDTAKGLAFLLSIGVVLVLGFSSCFGVGSTF